MRTVYKNVLNALRVCNADMVTGAGLLLAAINGANDDNLIHLSMLFYNNANQENYDNLYH